MGIDISTLGKGRRREMMNDPLFSVVIPTYNRAAFIEQTIDSVLRQTFEDFEVIIVDDGSTDNTEEIVRLIKDPRLSYHPQKNEERAVARNTGTNQSCGTYVTFLDSDDLLYSNHLAVAEEMIVKFQKPEFFHLGYEFMDPSTRQSRSENTLPEIANDELLNGNSLSCRGVFLRKDIADNHQFNPDRELSGTEDYELWLRLASRYPLYCDGRVTSAIIQHDARSVVTTDRKKLEMRIGLLEKYLLEDEEFVKRFGGRISEFKANNRVYIALHLALAKNARLGAIDYLFRALRQSPAVLKQRAFYGTLKRLFV